MREFCTSGSARGALRLSTLGRPYRNLHRRARGRSPAAEGRTSERRSLGTKGRSPRKGRIEYEVMLPVDSQLWRLFQNHITTYEIAKSYVAVVLVLAALTWLVAERRSRAIWRQTPAPLDATPSIGRDGPYRQAKLPTFFERAPALVRWTSLAGVVVGALGVAWPILFVIELVSRTGILALAVEAVGACSAALSLISARAILRREVSFGSKRIAFVLAGAALMATWWLAYLFHAFDGVEVEAVGIKLRETTTVGAFLRSGFTVMVGGHFGATWRVLSRAGAVCGLLTAAYAVVWARAVSSARS
jgi:hypothetical protein